MTKMKGKIAIMLSYFLLEAEVNSTSYEIVLCGNVTDMGRGK